MRDLVPVQPIGRLETVANKTKGSKRSTVAEISLHAWAMWPLGADMPAKWPPTGIGSVRTAVDAM